MSVKAYCLLVKRQQHTDATFKEQIKNEQKKLQAQKSRMFEATYGLIIKFSLSTQPKLR